MSEMVERVAAALMDRMTAPNFRAVWIEQAEDVKTHWRFMARAAISAMREPTEEMMAGVDCSGEKAEWSSGRAWKAGHIAMIDAALK